MIKRVVLSIYILLLNIFITNTAIAKEYNEDERENIYIDSYKNVLFSARDVNDTRNSKLFVVYNQNAFIRLVKNDKFVYEKPENGCYKLENDISLCVEDGKITNLLGNYHTMANDEKIKRLQFTDEFYNEKNFECNKMKYEMIDKLFIQKKEIKGFQLQLYLLDFYSILKLIVYQDEDESVRGFILSSKNDIGCSPFNEFLIHKYKPPKEDKKKKKKKSKKNQGIEGRTEKERLQKIATESYKKMLLKGYTYLKPLTSTTEIQNVVLSLENSYLKSINILAVEFEWQYLDYKDLTYDFGEDKITETNKTKNKEQNKKSKK